MIRFIKIAFLLSLIATAAGAGWLAYYANKPAPLPETPYSFNVESGKSLKSVANQLAQENIIRHPWAFIFLVRASGKAHRIQAGSYLIDKDISPVELTAKLTEGDVNRSTITLVEGWNFRQIRQALDANPELRHDTKGLSDAEIMKRIGATESMPEGLFFPDTYHFDSGMSDLTVLKRSYTLLKSHLAKAWESRAPNLPYASPYEALIMASIIEKETGKPSEREEIAAVFVNRLRLGMRLQTDPTVIYGMGEEFDGNIRRTDLSTDTQYNTYTRFGLPPTPIASPGLESIKAALNPAQSRFLYFVSRGDGSHKFSETLEEHNKAVTQYQKKR